MEKLYQENENSLQKFIDNQLSLNDVEINDELDLTTLKTAFQIVSNKTKDLAHKYIAKEIIKNFSTSLFIKAHNNANNYEIRHSFIGKLSSFILSCEIKEIQDYLEPVLASVNSKAEYDYEVLADLFKEIIYAEDHLNSYENFWEVWNLFKPKIIELSKKNNYHADKVLKSYLFSQCLWKETAFEWRTFKDKDKRFFKEITTEIGHHPAVLYAMAKLLNGIGSCYLDDGIAWVSAMLSKNKKFLEAKLEDDTIYYLEHISKKYIYQKRETIKRTKQLKQEILVILNFLIDNGSVVGYMLRENIL